METQPTASQQEEEEETPGWDEAWEGSEGNSPRCFPPGPGLLSLLHLGSAMQSCSPWTDHLLEAHTRGLLVPHTSAPRLPTYQAPWVSPAQHSGWASVTCSPTAESEVCGSGWEMRASPGTTARQSSLSQPRHERSHNGPLSHRTVGAALAQPPACPLPCALDPLAVLSSEPTPNP